MSEQLTLNVALHEGLRFSSFYQNDENSDAATTLGLFSQPFQGNHQQIFLW